MSLTSKEKLARLRAALLESKNRQARRLLHDLDSCGVDWQGRYPCRSPICPRCRASNIRAQQAATRKFFDGVANTGLGWMSVVLGGTHDLDEVKEIIRKGYQGTRNRINAGRRSSTDWNGFAMKGWIEIDALAADHFPLLGSERRALLGEIVPVRFDQIEPVWLPSYHAIVGLGDLDLVEVRTAFERQWPVLGQVNIAPLHLDREAGDNLDSLASYANKHSCEIRLGHVREPWPTPWTVGLYSWLHGQRNAFEFLRFSIGEKVYNNPPEDQVDYTSYLGLDPLPIDISFNTFPMTY